MSKEINIKLTSAEAIEVVAFVSEFLDDIKPGAPIAFLRSIENKIKEQVVAQCNYDQLTDAIRDIEIQALLNNAP